MARKWLPIFIILTGMAFFLLPWAMPAHAQEPAPENDANCVACHEHQYFLYDSGKWFCLCDAPMHCIYCHGGQTDSMDKESAHEGLVLYPTTNHAERCQTCHDEDYMSRVVTFASVAGISSTPIAIITATPVESSAASQAAQPNSVLQRFSQFEPWRLVGLGGLGIITIGIIIFGYRCWKADCQLRKQN